MIQQINLYQIEKKKTTFDFAFNQMLLVLGGFFGIILIFTLYDTFQYLTVKKEFAALGKEQMTKAEKLRTISGQIPEEKTRNQIIEEIKKYESGKQEKQDIISLLISAQTNKINGFSGYFESLARQSIPGIWLTHISFKENGDYISLEGSALNPGYIPKLIAELGAEPVFRGKTFQLFKVAMDDKTKKMDFVLETKARQQL